MEYRRLKRIGRLVRKSRNNCLFVLRTVRGSREGRKLLCSVYCSLRLGPMRVLRTQLGSFSSSIAPPIGLCVRDYAPFTHTHIFHGPCPPELWKWSFSIFQELPPTSFHEPPILLLRIRQVFVASLEEYTGVLGRVDPFSIHLAVTDDVLMQALDSRIFFALSEKRLNFSTSISRKALVRCVTELHFSL